MKTLTTALTAWGLAWFAMLTVAAAAEVAEFDGNPGEGFRLLGQVKPRHAREIEASNWSIGAETMDRDFTIYANWKQHLGPLGAKKARIQSGWAKTEQRKGEYDWAWLDEIVLDMVQQGVEPWVCLCYGNPIYEGGGGTGLNAPLPSSPEALAAWDAYVRAVVERYGKHVDEWELWNEPSGSPAVYADLATRTARIIRQVQPKSRIIAAAWKDVKGILERLKENDALGLIDEFSDHPYNVNPDQTYGRAASLRKLLASYAPHLSLRQGENGAPSKAGGFGAIADYQWDEQRQAKWALRRLLGDLGRDIPSSYFSICDMQYPTRRNYKGLLAINDDKTVANVKKAYGAVQNVTAIFDATLQRIDEPAIAIEGVAAESVSAFAYRGPKGVVVSVWRSTDPPGKRADAQQASLSLEGLAMTEPVYVDMLSGKVYAIDATRWSKADGTATFHVPVYDSPILVAERATIGLVPIEQ